MQACPYYLLRVCRHILQVIFSDIHRFSSNTHSFLSIPSFVISSSLFNHRMVVPTLPLLCDHAYVWQPQKKSLITGYSMTLACASSLSLAAFHTTALPAKIKIRHQFICLPLDSQRAPAAALQLHCSHSVFHATGVCAASFHYGLPFHVPSWFSVHFCCEFQFHSCSVSRVYCVPWFHWVASAVSTPRNFST